jgi:poly-gamma-glutamate synthesis protein (capsule biosynthesis protein)
MALLRNLFNFFVWIISVWLLSALISSGYGKNRPHIDILPHPTHTDVTIVAVGDLISHQDVQLAARHAENGWASLWEEIAPSFRGADLAMVNLETPIAPRTGKPGIPYQFNASADLASALFDTGVDLVFTANNHSFDQGVAGLVETLEHLTASNVKQAGSGLTRLEALTPVIFELRGKIKVAVLARTDLFNSNLNSRNDRPWVAALDLSADEKTIREIRPDVDAVIVSVHWGNEYHALPSQRQKDAARRLIGAGVDVIIGHHPHVLQPFEWIEAEGRRGAVAYSLGNFLSNQHRMYDPATQPISAGDNRDGALIKILIRKDSSGVNLRDVSVEPIWTDNNWIKHSRNQSAKREIRVMNTIPGGRSAEMEALLTLRRKRAFERLGVNPG